MKFSRHLTAGMAVLGLLVTFGATAQLLATSASATATTPPWEPDPNAVGTLDFFTSAGVQVTGGSDLSHLFDYAAATSAGTVGATKATLYFANPTPNAATGTWFSQPYSASTNYPNASAPAPLNTDPDPVVTLGASDADLSNFIASSVQNTQTGYVNMYQIRVRDSGIGIPLSTTYWEADIEVDPTAGTWEQVYPPSVIVSSTSPTATPTSPTATPTSPTATPTSPTATPTSPTATPTSPTATPTSPTATPTSPTATPTSPTATPTSPTATPTSPTATPTSTSATPTATPTSTTATPTATATTTSSVPAAPSFGSASGVVGVLPTGSSGDSYTTDIAVTGNPTPTVTLVSGALPPGLSLTGDPELTGTPTTAGSYDFTLEATNSAGTATKSFTITIDATGTTTTTTTSSGGGGLPFTGFNTEAALFIGVSMLIGGGLLRRGGRHKR